MTKKHYLMLQPSEAVVAEMSATIFAAYIQSGAVNRDNEDEYVAISADVAIKLATYVDDHVKSEGELAQSSDGTLRL